MPVTTVHPEVTRRQAQGQRCRDTNEGEDAVKAAGVQYLPRLSKQSSAEYEAYKGRALWYGATSRTVQGLSGAVMRKDPKLVVPDAMQAQLDDITLTGTPATTFIKDLLNEVLITGRAGVLIDMPPPEVVDEQGMSRPYWVIYQAEQITNWKLTTVGGVPKLTMVVLLEQVESPGEDEFEQVCVPQYRVLSLDESGIYTVRLFQQLVKQGSRTNEFVQVSELTPVFRGTPLTSIPFCCLGPCTLDACPEKPPLLDLVNVNLSHYRSSADLEHGTHFTALPTPYITGVPKETTVAIGSATAWVLEDPNARCGMLEFTGQGLGAIEKRCDVKEKQMAILGARMLEQQKLGVEAAETLLMRNAGERSSLQSIAVTLGLGIEKLLKWHAAWIGAPTDAISAGINTEIPTLGRICSRAPM